MKKYRIKNWSEYNRSLVQRGSINLWFSEDAIQKWHSTEHTGKKGRPLIYSDDAILCALIVRALYKLPLRALQGFLISIACLLGLGLSIPSYTQICRRATSLGKILKKLSTCRPTDIVFDSTGLKIYGEGEWKVRQHGISKRRTWMKLHIGIDPDSQEIIVAQLTGNGNGCGDSEIGEELIKRVPKGIKKVFGDGGYDDFIFRQRIAELGAKPIIPPPRNAVLHGGDDPSVLERDRAVKEILGLGGDDRARKLWKIFKGYHKRSLVETTMYRLKQITGETLRSRKIENQQIEASIRCLIINRMTRLGMPKGLWEEAA
jgi:hypothetical protein